MFGLGPWEIAVIAGVVLVVAGPMLLPKLGGYIGKTLTGLRESATSFSENLREEMSSDRRDEPSLLTSGEEPHGHGTEARDSSEKRSTAA